MKHRLILAAGSALALATTASAQDNDPFTGATGPAGAPTSSAPARTPANLTVVYETFSLPLAEAASLIRGGHKDADLYATLLDMVQKETAAQECLAIVRVPSGQRASSESISEHIYPTEFEPPELPNTVGVQITPPRHKDVPDAVPNLDDLENAPPPDDLSSLATPSQGAAFDTRNLGLTVEVEPTVDPKTGLIDLRLAPEHVTLAGRIQWGAGRATNEVPEFETQRLSTGASIPPGIPYFIGTLNRPAGSKVQADAGKKVWFAFVTVTPTES